MPGMWAVIFSLFQPFSNDTKSDQHRVKRWTQKARCFGLNEFGDCVRRQLDFNKFVFIAMVSNKKGGG